MITKEMLKRCSNELKQAFCALPEDVQNVIKGNPEYRECLWHNGNGVCSWKQDNHIDGSPHRPWRLSPDTPTEPEYCEYKVTPDSNGWYDVKGLRSFTVSLIGCVGHKYFLGIIYVKDGTETLHTSVDAAFGVPIRVRFAKESK